MKSENDPGNALKDFFNQEYKKLVAFTQRYIGGGYFNISAEDIIQDVALNIYSKLDVNTPVANIAGYFYRSVRNKIIDIQRKPMRTISIEQLIVKKRGTQLMEALQYEDPDENQDWQNELTIERIHCLIETLKPDQQAIIIHTEFEGKTFEELSEEWHIPIGTLLSRKHRAMNKLQELIACELNKNEKL